MTRPDREQAPTFAARLAPMAISDIEAMTDREIADLMGASLDEVAEEPRVWREAAKAATNEYAERLVAAVEAGAAEMVTEPREIQRRLGGRPRVGQEPGSGPSNQVRVRVTDRTRAGLEQIASAQGRSLSEVSRDALDDYVARHAS